MTDPKAFRLALRLVNTDLRGAKKFFDDKRLTQQEKKILNAFIQSRDYKNEDIINDLEGMSCTLPFVECVRLYCLGMAYNNKTNFSEGRDFLKKSLALNTTFEGRYIKKISLHGLFLSCHNLKDPKGMKKALDDLESLGIKYEDDRIALEISRFTYLVYNAEYQEAKKRIPAMEQVYEQMSEVQVINYLLDLFDMYVAEELLTDASEALERIKLIRKFKSAPMVILLRALMDKLLHNKPFYLYKKDFVSSPYHLAHLECLIALEKGDDAEAMVGWMKLREFNPTEFKEPFKFTGTKNLFSMCLDRLITKPTLSMPVVVEGDKLEDKLLALLSSRTPVLKEVLYQELYGKPMVDKQDVMKLANVVYRLKKNYDCEVKTVKGAYLLVSVPEKIKAS